MKSTALFGLVILSVFITSYLYSQEGIKGLRIKELEGNAGKRWAVCIGINDYEDSTILDLEKARNDAKSMAAVFKEQGQFDWVFLMTDDLNPRDEHYPKKRNVINKLNFIKEFVAPNDLMVIFFSGHGVSDLEGKGYLVLADTYSDELFAESYAVQDMVSVIKETGVKKSLLIVDACREYFQENKGISSSGLYEEKFERAEIAATFYATKEGWSVTRTLKVTTVYLPGISWRV